MIMIIFWKILYIWRTEYECINPILLYHIRTIIPTWIAPTIIITAITPCIYLSIHSSINLSSYTSQIIIISI